MSASRRLTGRTVLVTGAGGAGAAPPDHPSRTTGSPSVGTGTVLATEFAKHGANVVAVDIFENSAKDTVQRVTRAGGSAIAVQADITDPADVARLFDEAESAFRRVDIVINNAGVGSMDPVLDTDDISWRRLIDVNLTGPFLVCRRALPSMIAASSGVIINVVSIAGLTGGRAGAGYTAAKHGLIGLTKNLAVTYGGLGVRCAGICPGTIRTNADAYDGPAIAATSKDRLMQAQATNFRAGSPEEVAEVALFLASDAASYMNGSIVAVDGGWSAV